MNIERKFVLHYVTIKEIDTLDKFLLSIGCDVCDYSISLEFDDETINDASKEQFINIVRLKNVDPKDFRFTIRGKKTFKKGEKYSYEFTETLYSITLNALKIFPAPLLLVRVEAPEVEKAYLISSKIEEILPLKKPENTPVVQNKKDMSVFIAHSFDAKGKGYGKILGNFLYLLGFDVKSGEKYSPEPVDLKIKKRLSEQHILVTIYSPKLDYTWLHQESGGGIFTDKPIFILKEKGVKITEGIIRGRDVIGFTKKHIEEAFIPILEGLEEIGY